MALSLYMPSLLAVEAIRRCRGSSHIHSPLNALPCARPSFHPHPSGPTSQHQEEDENERKSSHSSANDGRNQGERGARSHGVRGWLRIGRGRRRWRWACGRREAVFSAKGPNEEALSLGRIISTSLEAVIECNVESQTLDRIITRRVHRAMVGRVRAVMHGDTS
eukprot:scaffold17769_cov33-Tisochrysis_lutea.AAC.1